jgi:hypothetical protein
LKRKGIRTHILFIHFDALRRIFYFAGFVVRTKKCGTGAAGIKRSPESPKKE